MIDDKGNIKLGVDVLTVDIDVMNIDNFVSIIDKVDGLSCRVVFNVKFNDVREFSIFKHVLEYMENDFIYNNVIFYFDLNVVGEEVKSTINNYFLDNTWIKDDEVDSLYVSCNFLMSTKYFMINHGNYIEVHKYVCL